MLLYDRLMRHAVDHQYSDQDQETYRLLRTAQVFEISAIVPLFQDWERDRILPISKRPPYENLWGEWVYHETDPRGRWTWTIGCLLTQVSPESLSDKCRRPGAAGYIHEDFWTCDDFYMAQKFSYQTQTGTPEMQPVLHKIFWVLGHTVFGMRHASTEVRTIGLYPNFATMDPLVTRDRLQMHRFGLDTHLPSYSDRYMPMNVPWPLLMAFALLHCRNITTQTVTPAPKLSKKHQKHGHPPLTIYKVLQVVVPITRPPPARLEAQAPQHGVRLHLCRGHFKHLQHERFKQPGWHWWPAHWRGNPAVGRVEKTYALRPLAEEPTP